MAKRRVVEIGLHSVEIDAGSKREKAAVAHVLAARLIWPRPAIAEKVAVKTLAFNKGRADVSQANWGQRILFKETVQGPCGVALELTRHASASQAAAFAHVFYAAVLTALSAQVGAMAPGESWVGLLRHPLRFWAREAGTQPKTWPTPITAGSIDLNPEHIGPAETTATLTIPLAAPEDIFQMRRRQRAGKTVMRRERLWKAGESNGLARLTVTAYT